MIEITSEIVDFSSVNNVAAQDTVQLTPPVNRPEILHGTTYRITHPGERNGYDNKTDYWCGIWCQIYGVAAGPYGDADLIAKANGITVKKIEKFGRVTASKGAVKLCESCD